MQKYRRRRIPRKRTYSFKSENLKKYIKVFTSDIHCGDPVFCKFDCRVVDMIFSESIFSTSVKAYNLNSQRFNDLQRLQGRKTFVHKKFYNNICYIFDHLDDKRKYICALFSHFSIALKIFNTSQ